MKYLVTAAEMKQYDAAAISRIGIPGPVLMERAAMGVRDAILAHFGKIGKDGIDKSHGVKKVLILAGMGNNGGDGLALARLLCMDGFEVEIRCIGDETHATAQWQLERKILAAYPVIFVEDIEGKEYDCCVDAIFGVGLARKIEGTFREMIETVNKKKGYKISVDVPSGIDSDTGKVLGCAFRADRTVTFGFAKRGLFFFPGKDYAGEVSIVPVGIDETAFFGEKPGMYFLDEPINTLLPERSRDGNKGTFGKVLVIGGSINMAGAAILSAKACYRTGTGMVKIISDPENRTILQQALPEALLGNFDSMDESLDWADVVVAGPGLGRGKNAFFAVKKALEKGKIPMVLDADALNLVAESRELMEKVTESGMTGRSIIMTPHAGELSRLCGKTIEELKKDLPGNAMTFAGEHHVVVAAKDARTFVCRKDYPICMNIRGTSGMATAGSGDVLAGIIAGLLAQHMMPFDAACTGVYLHALAGEMAEDQIGEYAMMAGDIIENIGKVMKCMQ